MPPELGMARGFGPDSQSVGPDGDLPLACYDFDARAVRRNRCMARTATVRANVSPDLKHSPKRRQHFSAIGVSPAEAIRLFYRQVTLHRDLPFETRIPNAETREAMRHGRKWGKTLVEYADLDELKAAHGSAHAPDHDEIGLNGISARARKTQQGPRQTLERSSTRLLAGDAPRITRHRPTSTIRRLVTPSTSVTSSRTGCSSGTPGQRYSRPRLHRDAFRSVRMTARGG